MLVLLMYTLLSIFGAQLSNSVPKKGRDPSRSISMVNLTEGWAELRVSRNWPAVILSKPLSKIGSTRHSLNLSKTDLIDLLRAATKNQLFQFDGALYEQTDGVAMGSPLGPLLANVFMCSIEENLGQHGQLPRYYRRYVDDTLTVMPEPTRVSFCTL